ncbi:DUF1127 domain-containing protein [Bradyrhizobium stylosanthis]|uniref:DUF1127 domain-containing protein n=1 Tax=Bradyrhizobium stylosanthis TaxID=1803665 RepID=UPI0007C49E68|nr:DUF1127 domain-containing protein [Bradyrhizobium stylosanthis]
MATTFDMSTSRRTLTPVRLGSARFGLVRFGLDLLTNCRAALRERHERRRVTARLDGLSDMALHDIGISRGEIDYVAANRAVDPRGARSAP